jgi:hypothetical protein
MNKFEAIAIATIVGIAELGAITLALASGFVWCVILFGGV